TTKPAFHLLAGQPASPGRIALRRLKKNRIAMAGAALLVCLYLVAVFAAFIAPYSPAQDEFRNFFFHPPMGIHFRDEQGHFCRPYVLKTYLVDADRVIYSYAKPLYVFYRNPVANRNPYLPDTIESDQLVLSVETDRGLKVATAEMLQETADNSGIF